MNEQQQQQQVQHPKVLINIMLINCNETRILFVKKKNQSYWDLLGHVLEYGETYEKRVKRIMSETTFKMDENIFDKIKYICSFNAVNEEKKRHFVEIMYALKISEKEMIYVDESVFKYWRWMTMDEINEEQLFFGFQKFLEKYKVKEIKDILKIKSI